MESPSNNTMIFLGGKEGVAQFVSAILQNFELASQLTITITPVRYEDYYVTIVIDDSSDDTETLISLGG